MNRLMRNIFIEAFCVTISFAQIAPSTTFEQAEQSIAINPTNSDNIIVTTISIDRTVQEKYVSIFYTFNGGTNWVKTEPLSIQGGGDPVIKFDPDGKAYLLYQVRSQLSLYLQTSGNGGVSWSEASVRKHCDNIILVGNLKVFATGNQIPAKAGRISLQIEKMEKP